jgi:beta-RFAP synthase
MFSFGHADRPQFGGVGIMIEPPVVEVTIKPAVEFLATGDHADRVKYFAAAAAASWHLPYPPPCSVHVHSPQDHVGLGVGTQLSLATAAGLRRFLQLPDLPVVRLAQDVGRGGRSAVGTHGFQHGGLIVDAGHGAGDTIGELAQRMAVPDEWRCVLVCAAGQRGLAGSTEAEAFSRLPPVPQELSRQLWEIAQIEMVPALQRRQCHEFGESVYRFGRLAGECFAAVQGGPFASREIEQLIDAIRGYGISGVGQSSWGPTVFAICESDAVAHGLCDWLRARTGSDPYFVSIASPNNTGAQIKTLAGER